MIRAPDVEGFGNRAAPVVSRLGSTVAASVAVGVGVLALCLIVALFVISARVGAATPL